MGAFITTLPQGKTLNDTSIYTSGLRFDSSSFPVFEDEPLYEDVDDAEESPSYDDAPVSSSRTSAHSAQPTTVEDPIDTDMDSTEEAELEQELEAELMEELLEAEEEVDEAEFAAEEAAYEGRPIQKRAERGLPSLRIGFAGAGGKRRLTKRQIVDEFGLEDLGFADSGEADDAQAEAIEEIIQEMEDEQAAQEAEEEMADEYEEVTSTSTSSFTKPTSSPKRPSSTLGSAMVEGSSNAVPVYNGPITYAVPKTGYYCVGK